MTNCTVPIHPLQTALEPPRRFNSPFAYTPHPLVKLAAEQVMDHLRGHGEWAEELAAGKMLGVLVVRKDGLHAGNVEPHTGNVGLPAGNSGQLGYLAAFSGLLGGSNRQPFFVPPIYDLLDPQGHFQQEQAVISGINGQLEAGEGDAAALAAERKRRSEALQDWLFDQYECLNARGERQTITQIFTDFHRAHTLRPSRLDHNAATHHIPSGAGECCAPKLLQAAFLAGLTPLCMGEFWVGRSPLGEVRHAGQFYPACHAKCRPILDFMLRGLDVEMPAQPSAERLFAQARIVWQDQYLAVVEKPSGLLSVPGRGSEPHVMQWLQGQGVEAYYPCHRLDQDTSGLLVVAKTEEAYRCVQQQFARHEVEKTYLALLDGEPAADSGTIRLPLAPDAQDRPRQKVDFAQGKSAVTHFRVLTKGGGSARVLLTPDTGRTHQLRLHCAHPAGLGCPIHGDRLYGTCTAPPLCLHANFIQFTHPIGKQLLKFESEPNF